MKVKICGLTSLSDAMMAINLGATALGFNFYSKSPRYIQPIIAADIIRALPSEVETVGIFVNAPLTDIIKIQSLTAIHTIQLHGDEPLTYCAQIPFPVIKAVRPSHLDAVGAIELFDKSLRVLVDAPLFQGAYGGTGQLAHWGVAKALAKKRDIMLAGGIHAQNVIEAMEFVKPNMLDVCSGVETSPGVKSFEKMKRLFDALY